MKICNSLPIKVTGQKDLPKDNVPTDQVRPPPFPISNHLNIIIINVPLLA